MARQFSELRAKMSPEARARAEIKAQAMLAEMPLNELRQARGLSQKMLAEGRDTSCYHAGNTLTWRTLNGTGSYGNRLKQPAN